MKDVRHVFIVIPTIGHAMTDGIVRFAYGIGQADADPKVPFNFTLRVLTGTSGISYPVEYMRNKAVESFLKTDCDALWFIDSDTLPTADAMKLLDIDADIVGGIYPLPEVRKNNVVWSVYDWNDDNKSFVPKLIPAPDESQIIPCDGLGTGCMIIHRRVLEDPKMRFAPNGDGAPPIFRTVRYPNGECKWTDDLDFCSRTRDLGYTMKCHAGVKWGHVKTTDVAFALGVAERAFVAGVKLGSTKNSVIDSAH